MVQSVYCFLGLGIAVPTCRLVAPSHAHVDAGHALRRARESSQRHQHRSSCEAPLCQTVNPAAFSYSSSRIKHLDRASVQRTNCTSHPQIGLCKNTRHHLQSTRTPQLRGRSRTQSSPIWAHGCCGVTADQKLTDRATVVDSRGLQAPLTILRPMVPDPRHSLLLLFHCRTQQICAR